MAAFSVLQLGPARLTEGMGVARKRSRAADSDSQQASTTEPCFDPADALSEEQEICDAASSCSSLLSQLSILADNYDCWHELSWDLLKERYLVPLEECLDVYLLSVLRGVSNGEDASVLNRIATLSRKDGEGGFTIGTQAFLSGHDAVFRLARTIVSACDSYNRSTPGGSGSMESLVYFLAMIRDVSRDWECGRLTLTLEVERLLLGQRRSKDVQNDVNRDANQPTTEEVTENGIWCEGAVWHVRYEGEQGAFAVKDFRALETIAKLVVRPNRHVDITDLVDDAARHLLNQPGSRTDVLDDPAIADLKRRYDDLLIDKAKQDDLLVKNEIEQEIASIAAELRKAIGIGGRKRKLGCTPLERSWSALTKSLRRLWPRLRNAGMPNLADHLQAAIKMNCPHITYNPQGDTPPLNAKR